MNLTKKALLCGVVATIFVRVAEAAPFTLTQGSLATLSFNGFYDSSHIVIPGLSGVVTLSNVSFNAASVGGQAATRLDMNYQIVNDSKSPILTSRISNFAFNSSPEILSGASNRVTGTFSSVKLGANQPNGIGNVDICFTAANCPGGGSGGVTMGSTGSGTATLYFGGTISALTIDSAFLRYQSVSCGNGSACNSSASGELISPQVNIALAPTGSVPEPSTYAMISLGLGAIAFGSRRKARS